MGNIIDEIQKLIKTAENAEQTLIDYIKESNDKELLTEESSAGKTLIDIALDEKYENFLCAVLEKFPELAKIQNGNHNTFLHYAADKGLSEVLLKALEVDNPKLGLAKIQNGWGKTFLHYAAKVGMSKVLMKALEVDPSLAKIQGNYRDTFLHYAADKGMSDVLLKALEVDPSLATIQNNYDNTFLHYAADKGLSEVLKKISPELLIKNDKGLDPIDVYNCCYHEKIEKPKETLSFVLASRAKSLKDKQSDGEAQK